MPVIIDGNNLLHSLPRAERSRSDVRRRALDAVRQEGMQLTVVFDGPPPQGMSGVEHLGRVSVRYSGAETADAVIVRMLPPGRRAADWVVVTDDRGLQAAAKERGAKVRSLQEWKARRPKKRPQKIHQPKLSSRDVKDWEQYFSEDENREES